jgi:hypothetical protein
MVPSPIAVCNGIDPSFCCGSTLPRRTQCRSRFTHGAGCRRSGSTALTTAIERANLQRADLTGAWLNDAEDTDDPPANLQGADLTSAVLKDAEVTDEQLAKCKTLEGATMPDGQTLKSDDNPDGPTLKEWLKSKGKGEK